MAAPDSFISFYGSDFFTAMDGRSNDIVAGYLRALWYYWRHTHCSGLEDDDEFLQELCRIKDKQWEQSKAVIFNNHGKFFTYGDDGLWHQKRAREEWAIASKNYDDKMHRTKAATDARLRNVRRNV